MSEALGNETEKTANGQHPFTARPLGLAGFPYPTFDFDSGRVTDLATPPVIWTQRSWEEVTGIAYRDMPIPTMIPAFIELLGLETPNSRKRLAFLRGEKGIGKSYMPELIGRLQRSGRIIRTEVGDKSAASALWEIDFLEGTGSVIIRHGAVIRGFLEGRQVLVDEFNKAVEGSQSQWHQLLQFLAGEIDWVDLNNEHGKNFSFERKDMKDGFFVTLTGNNINDGNSTLGLPASTASRIKDITFINPTEQDWSHRFCQFLTGLPISTLYNANPDWCDRNPNLFHEMLKRLRTMGLTDKEIADIPAHQYTFIANWKKVVTAAERVAQVYHAWQTYIDGYEQQLIGGSTSNNAANQKIWNELNQEYIREFGPSMRRMGQDIEAALIIPPKTKERIERPTGIERIMATPILVSPREESATLYFGDRLAYQIVRRIKMYTERRPNLQAALLRAAEGAGLAQTSSIQNSRAFGPLLNQEPVEEAIIIIPEVAELQRTLLNIFRKNDPALVRAADDEVVKLTKLQKTYDGLMGLTPSVVIDDFANVIILPIKSDDAVLQASHALDGYAFALSRGQRNGTNPAASSFMDELISADVFLTSLALPYLGNKNLAALWCSATERLIQNRTSAREASPQAKMMAGTYSEKIAATIVTCQDSIIEEQKCDFIIIRNQSSNGVVIFAASAGVNRDVQGLLAGRRITYCDISLLGDDAPAQIRKTLESVMLTQAQSPEKYAKICNDILSSLAIRLGLSVRNDLAKDGDDKLENFLAHLPKWLSTAKTERPFTCHAMAKPLADDEIPSTSPRPIVPIAGATSELR